MKRLLYVVLGLVLAFIVLVVVVVALAPAPPAGGAQQPVAAVAPVAAADSTEVAIEGVSPSSAYSRRLRGVFMRSLTCTPGRIRLGDSVDVEVKEIWLERLWEPKSGGLFGDADFSQGYALDSASEFPRSQLVMTYTPASRLGHFDQNSSSWRLNLSSDTYKEHGFSRSRGKQLVMSFVRSNAVFPLKFYVLARPKPCPDCQPPALDSLVIHD